MILLNQIKKYLPGPVVQLLIFSLKIFWVTIFKIKGVKMSYRILANFYYGKIEIEPGAIIRKGCWLGGNIKIGRFTSLNSNVSVIGSSQTKVIIGKYTSIAPEVVIQSENHILNRLTTCPLNYFIKDSEDASTEPKGDIVIGNDVWIGRRAIILPGVKIGDGAVIGAGAIVTKNVIPYSIVAGVPAKKIRKRFDEKTIKVLLGIKWWDLSIRVLNRNKKLFELDLNQNENIQKIKF